MESPQHEHITSHVSVNPMDAFALSRDGELYERLLVADEQSQARISLGLWWRELVRGSYEVVAGLFGPARCALVLLRTSEESGFELTGRRLEILESILCGIDQTYVALDLSLSPSTVSLDARVALERLGVSTRPSRVHPVLMLAAAAARQGVHVPASLSYSSIDGVEVSVVGIARPDDTLKSKLSPAEFMVAGCLFEGLSYAEIAQRRRTSTRTIANQIAAVFRRLGISGRNDLVMQMFASSGLIPMPRRNGPPIQSRPPAPGSSRARRSTSPERVKQRAALARLVVSLEQ